jgi:uncharacterized protein (TIGR02145 family)
LNLGGNYINELKTQGTDSPANTEEYRAANIKYVRDYVSAYVDGNATLPSGLIKDSEGNIYTTKLFGSKMWMTENLKIGAHTTPNGKTLRVCNATEWATNPTDTFCYATSAAYNAAADAGTQLANKGYLYQWDAAMDGDTAEESRGICPSGWHIPSDQEWQTLEGDISSGSNVPDTPTFTGWRFGTNGDGSTAGSTTVTEQVGTQMKLASKMNVLVAGYRSATGVQSYQGTYTAFWSSSQLGSDAWSRLLGSSNAGVYRNTRIKARGFSVRCIKD